MMEAPKRLTKEFFDQWYWGEVPEKLIKDLQDEAAVIVANEFIEHVDFDLGDQPGMFYMNFAHFDCYEEHLFDPTKEWMWCLLMDATGNRPDSDAIERAQGWAAWFREFADKIEAAIDSEDEYDAQPKA